MGTTPGYGLLNLRLEWNKVMQTPVDLAIFANNALDKHYVMINYSLANEIGHQGVIYGSPAMYGIEATYHFR